MVTPSTYLPCHHPETRPNDNLCAHNIEKVTVAAGLGFGNCST